MGKSSKQKNKKLDKRKKKSALKKKAAIKQKIKNASVERRLKEYPNFHYKDYDKNSVSEEFVNEVKQILNSLDFNDKTLFNPPAKNFFKQMKKYGFGTTIRVAQDMVSEEERDALYTYYVIFIGDIAFEKLKQKGVLEKYIPFNDVEITPQGYDFKVTFNGMLWEKTKWGRVHYSPKKHKISIEGKEYTVAFSNHAIERICGRCVKNWKKYEGIGDAFGFFNKYSKFEIVKTIQNNETQYFLTIYDLCQKGFSSYNYLTKILENHESNRSYYYRVGYCPIELNENFASAKTLLIPGMKGTPENIKMKDSDLDFNDKKRYEKLAGSILKNELSLDSSDWDALRWYHENGIPQVVELEEYPFG